jgi:hypothetical protein
MKTDKISLAVAIFIGLFICFVGCNKREQSKPSDFKQISQNAFPVFYERIDDVGDYVLSCQIPQGGLCRNIGEKNNQNGKEAFMTTYCFGGTALIKAFQMTGKKEYLDGAKKFIDFWMAYQNKEPDRFGVIGTFYDKYIDNQTGEIKEHYYDKAESVSNQGGPGYDASDADGPTIAWTAWEYYKLTGDRQYLEQYREHFKLILKSMQATVDPADWLTYCHPRWSFKYLMDVCEVWAFLDSLENIFHQLSEQQLAEDCRLWKANIRQTINKNWWNSEKGWYYWYLDNGGNYNSGMNWHKWYPDAAEQIWPMLWGVTSTGQAETQAVWKEFNQNIQDWCSKDLDWPMVSTTAIMMGDYDKAFNHTSNILTKRLTAPDFQTNHCYFVILNCCMDFELTGSLHLVANSYYAGSNQLKFDFSSIPAGGGDIVIRLNKCAKPSLYIDGKQQAISSKNGKIVVPVRVKAGQIKSFSLTF